MGARAVLRRAARPAAAAVASRWPQRSRLFVVGDSAGWSVAEDARAIRRLARLASVRVAPDPLLTVSHGQAAFYASQFELLRDDWSAPSHALGVAYLHGRPGTPGMPEFDACFRALSGHRDRIERVQVTHAEMRDLALEAGVAAERIHLIPIGIDPAAFPPRTADARWAARARLGLPEGVFVVGSFQKDGVGAGAGDEPKLIKGPDVLVEAAAALRARVPEAHLLLSGPARGYVRRRLDELGVPWTHRLVDGLDGMGELYAALDAYAVTSRQEGGPKAVLEAMASGVPLVSTRVGQAVDLVRDGENGFLVDVGDTEALADRLALIATDAATAERLAAAGRPTAEAHAYDRQLPLWETLFEGFVRRG